MAESRGRQGRDRGGSRPGLEGGRDSRSETGRGGQESWGALGEVGSCSAGSPSTGPFRGGRGGLSRSSCRQGRQGEAGAARNVGETRSLGSVTDRCQSGDKCRPSSSRSWAAIEGCRAWAGTGPEARKPVGGASGQLEGLPSYPQASDPSTTTTKVSPQHQGVDGPGPVIAAKLPNHLSTTQREVEAWKDPSPPPSGPPGHWASS